MSSFYGAILFNFKTNITNFLSFKDKRSRRVQKYFESFLRSLLNNFRVNLELQTFLPYPNFKQSAACLDYRRLNKQILECQQILNALINPEAKGWRNHTATLMWKGFEYQLFKYAEACYIEWVSRGYGPNHKSWQTILSYDIQNNSTYNNKDLPTWFGRDDFHLAHKSNLLRKNKQYYTQFNWDVDDTLGYVWPSKE